jgi:hypothetical protein
MDPGRLWRVALLLVLVATRGQAQETTLVVQSSPLAGFRYHAAVEERDNPHDANAVSVSWRGRKLGYVPRHENAALAWGLDRGAQLTARISRLAPDARPSRRVEFEVVAE